MRATFIGMVGIGRFRATVSHSVSHAIIRIMFI